MIATVATAAAWAGMTVCFRMTPSFNYTATGMLGQAGVGFIRAVSGFLLGAYGVASLYRVGSRRERDIVPWLVSSGAAVGAWGGAMLSMLLPSAGIVGGLGGAWIGARLACQVQTVVPKSRIPRLMWTCVGVVMLGSPAIIATPRPSFPADATVEVRHQWATERFGRFYTEVTEYLKSSHQIRQELGEIQTMAPTTGRNSIGSGPGEVLGTFTLELIGNQDRAIATVEFQHFSDRSIFTGTLTSDGQTVTLPQLVKSRDPTSSKAADDPTGR